MADLLSTVNAQIESNRAKEELRRLQASLTAKYNKLAHSLGYRSDSDLTGLVVASASAEPDGFLVRFTDGTYLFTTKQAGQWGESDEIVCGQLTLDELARKEMLSEAERIQLSELKAAAERQALREQNERIARQSLRSLTPEQRKALLEEFKN